MDSQSAYGLCDTTSIVYVTVSATSTSVPQSITSSTSSHSSTTTTLSSSSSSSKSTTSTTTATSTSSLCTGTPTGIAIASPTPSGAVCDIQADSVTLAGAGLLTAYTSGSPYVTSVQACAAECIATSTCTNIYFVAGANCNLHYGPTSYVLNTNGVNAYSLYDVSCFTTCAIML